MRIVKLPGQIAPQKMGSEHRLLSSGRSSRSTSSISSLRLSRSSSLRPISQGN
ncbi:protein of unassigned function [Methylobacterium oryzae CBMB20]|uniref:Protein of unassigned function n=1 Tax=Methylobacterium oryzae CBMB20 TaxID=693986 RepID=A0A089QEY1_9HYPH|nr:protein of unassigned function [Methylobacterium oryzae CBMB20]